MAAGFAFLHGVAEAENSVARHKFLHVGGFWRHDADAHAKRPLRPCERVIGLRKMAACVECYGLDAGLGLRDAVEENLILQSKARGKNNLPCDGVFYCADSRGEIAVSASLRSRAVAIASGSSSLRECLSVPCIRCPAHVEGC